MCTKRLRPARRRNRVIPFALLAIAPLCASAVVINPATLPSGVQRYLVSPVKIQNMPSFGNVALFGVVQQVIRNKAVVIVDSTGQAILILNRPKLINSLRLHDQLRVYGQIVPSNGALPELSVQVIKVNNQKPQALAGIQTNPLAQMRLAKTTATAKQELKKSTPKKNGGEKANRD